MKICIRDRYKFIITRDGEYFQAWNIYEEGWKKKTARWSVSKASARKFESMIEAREEIKAIGGGCRILRYDMLTTEIVDVWEELKRPTERRWVNGADMA